MFQELWLTVWRNYLPWSIYHSPQKVPKHRKWHRLSHFLQVHRPNPNNSAPKPSHSPTTRKPPPAKRGWSGGRQQRRISVTWKPEVWNENASGGNRGAWSGERTSGGGVEALSDPYQIAERSGDSASLRLKSPVGINLPHESEIFSNAQKAPWVNLTLRKKFIS